MKFDNKQFEAGVAQSMSTLEKFEDKLKFKDASKGLENVSRAADKFSLDSITKQADAASQKFDALAIIAISALNRITNEAITAGTKLLKSLSIDQVTSGWSKYEARTAAVQTLVNATGKSVEQIEKYMDKLMLYSDETSYGFDDMTSALATMVSAGGDINKLVPVLEGFGNAVSFVGKGAAEYKRAIIQLSQGYGRDALMLEDWKSIESTLGGAKQLKEVFIEVGEELKKIKKGQYDIGTFNESLKKKWLDQEVMEVALGRFAEMTEKAFEMIEAGEAENMADAYAILSESVDDYRIKAAKAAQEAKSFTEAIEATKDAVSTKWMESFQIIFGNYEEATQLWTELTNTLWDLFAASGDTRNEILNVWRSFEGREAMIDAAKAAFQALYVPVKAVGDAINQIFFPGSAAEKGFWLANATKAVRDFFQALILSDEAANTLRMTFKLLLIPVYAVYQVLRLIGTVIVQTIVLIFALANALLSLPSRLGAIENPLRRVFGDERYARLVAALATIVEKLGEAMSAVGKSIATIGRSIATAFSGKLAEAITKIAELLAPIAGWILDRIVDGFELLASLDYSKIVDWVNFAISSLADGLSIIIGWCKQGGKAVIEFFSKFFTLSPIEMLYAIIDAVKSMKDRLVEFAKSLGFDRLLQVLSEAGANVIEIVLALGNAIADFTKNLTPAKVLIFAFGASIVWLFFNLAKAVTAFRTVSTAMTRVLDTVTGTLKAFQARLKANPILQIAFAIAVLAVSLGALAQIDSDRLFAAAKSLAIVMVALIGVVAVIAILNKALNKAGDTKMARNIKQLATSFLSIAAAAALLSAALYILSNVNIKNVIAPLFAIIVLIGILTGAIALMNKIMSKTASLANAGYIIAFALSLNLMVEAFNKLNGADLARTITNVISLGLIVSLMVVLSLAASKIRLTSGVAMIMFATSLLGFMLAIRVIAIMDTAAILKALINLAAIFVPLGTIVLLYKTLSALISRIPKKGSKDAVSENFLKIAAGMILMFFAIKSIGDLSLSTIAKGVGVIAAIIAFSVILSRCSTIILKEKESAYTTQVSFLALAASIILLSVAIDYIGGMNLTTIAKGTTVVLALILFLSIFAQATADAKKATGAIAAMTVCIALVVSAMALLTLLDPIELYTRVGALILVFSSLALLFWSAENLTAEKALAAVGELSVALLLISATFNLLEDVGDPSMLITKAEAIGLILAELAASFVILSRGGKETTWKQYAQTMATLGATLTMSGVALWLIDKALPDDMQSVMLKAKALGDVLLALSASLATLSLAYFKDNKDIKAKEIAGPLIVLGLVAGAITAVLTTDLFKNTEDLITKATAFAIVINAMSAAVALISAFSKKIKDLDKSSIGPIITLGAVVGVLAGVSVALLHFMEDLPGDEKLLKNVLIFSAMLAAVIGCIDLLTLGTPGFIALGTAGGAAIEGIAIATGTVIAIGALIAAIGALFTDMEGIEATLERSDYILTKLGTIIGHFIGGTIGGLIEQLEKGLGAAIESFGTHLSNFAKNVTGFANLKIDPNLGTTMQQLGIGILAITGGELLDRINTITGGKSSLKKLGQQLSEFAPYFKSFADDISGIDNEQVIAASKCLEAVGTVLANIPTEGGLMGAIFGEKSLDKFGSGLSTVAQGIMDYGTVLRDNELDDDTIEKSNKVVQALIDLANQLPKTGLLQDLLGKQDFGEFGSQLSSFGESLKQYITMTKEIKAIYDEEAFKAAQTSAETMINIAKTVPDSSLFARITGIKDIGTFGKQVGQFGLGLASFFRAFMEGTDENGNKLSAVKIDTSLAESAKTAAEYLSAIAKDIPSDGGWVGKITGRQDLGDFGSQTKKFGEGIAGFFKAVDEVGLDEGMVKIAKQAGDAFVEIANSLDADIVDSGWISTSAFEDFSNSLGKLGKGISDFYNNIKDVGTGWYEVSVATDNIKKIVELLPSLEHFNSNAFSEFSKALSDLGYTGVAEFNLAFSKSYVEISDHVYGILSAALLRANYILQNYNKNVFSGLVDVIVNGIESRSDDLSETAGKLTSLTIKSLSEEAESLRNVGIIMIDSLIEGFGTSSGNLETKATDCITTAIKSVEMMLIIKNGVSEIFVQIGTYCIDGFIKGINDSEPKLTKTLIHASSIIVDKFEHTLGINSPSKRFAEIGMYSMLGLKKGIDDNSDDVTESLIKMGAEMLESIKSYYGIHSPSTVMRDEVGRYIVKGIAEGIAEDMSAEDAAAKKAQNIIDAFQSEFNKWTLKINTADIEYSLWSAMNPEASEDMVRQQEIELLETKLANQAEIVNTADAKYQALIKSSYATEEQIQEAKNALTQEQTKLWELANQLVETRRIAADSLELERAELEYEQWQLLNKNATDDELKAKELDLLDKKLAAQAQVVADANDTYNRLLDTYGEGAKETREALNNYLSESNNMLELANDYADKYNEGAAAMPTKEAYNEAYLSMIDAYQAGRITIPEMQMLAKGVSGYDPDNPPEDRAETAAKIMDRYMTQVSEKIDDLETASEIVERHMSNASGSIDNIIGNIQIALDETASATKSAAKKTTQSVNDTIKKSSSGLDLDLEDAMKKATEGLGFDLGASMTGDWIDGIRNNLGGVGDSLVEVAQSGFNKLKSFIGLGGGESSGSSPFKDLGNSIMKLFGKGIEETSEEPVAAAANTTQAVVGAMDGLPSNAYDVGKQMDEGLAQGINDNTAPIAAAAANAASIALNSTKDALDVHSPSRKYYYIGEMMNEGLANGLTDSTSVVRNAIENVLNDAQDATLENPLEASITPVIDGNNPRNRQALRYSATGEVTPTGYRDGGQTSWWTTEITAAVQRLSEAEEARKTAEQTAFAEYKQSLDELKGVVQQMSDKPAAIGITQNNYSPKALSASTIYRNTKTALARASAEASPSGRSLNQDR